MDHKEIVNKYLMRGCCCSEALVRLGLEILGEEDNERLIDAAAGMCNGMHDGGVCGGLTGGCMLLAMMDRDEAPFMCEELHQWFEVTYAEEYGSMNCKDILGTDPWNMLERCRPMILDIAEKCCDILEENALI